MSRKAVVIPTSLLWVFMILLGVILMILISRGALFSGNAVISVMEEYAKLMKCFSDKGFICILSG